ncbi:hypothetical protein TWF132_001301 [Orbilia oligospora]|nr:hypothetical protein TWF128_008820 [Orbilia oligospora]KAF3278044.1 hypothetical protein TWF132_001301 [Orbilia oligospora]
MHSWRHTCYTCKRCGSHGAWYTYLREAEDPKFPSTRSIEFSPLLRKLLSAMALFERIPLEIEREIVSYLYKPRLVPRDTRVRNSPDLLNLIKCNSKLHDRYISYLYDELRFFFPRGIRNLYPPESNYHFSQRYDFKLGTFSKMGLNLVRSFSLITRDSASTGNYEQAEDELTEELYEALLLPMSRNNILARLQAEGKTPSYMPEILNNMSPNLVYLSMDIDGTTGGNLTAQDFNHLRFQSLQRIRLMIKPSLRNAQIAYSILKAAPELVEVDLDFLSFREPRVYFDDDDEYQEPPSDLDRKRDPETYFIECSALSGLSKLQRLSICYADCGGLLSSVRFENLKDISLKYCRNWDALAKYTTNNKLRLKHLHISAQPIEIQGIKSFLDDGLEPGLETLIVTIDTIPDGNTFFSNLRKHERRNESIYFLKKESVLKHESTLRNIGFNVALGREDGWWEPKSLTRYISVLPYLPNIRAMLENSPNMRELSLVVPILCVRDDLSEIEVDSFRNLRLETIEVLYLIPTSWPTRVHLEGTDGACSESSVQWVIIDFLEAAFQHYTERPRLKYVVFGLHTHRLPPFEYKVEWVDGVSQMEKVLQEDPKYYDEHGHRDKYAKPRDSAGTWRLETLDYKDYPEETNVKLYHREWLEETHRKRLRREKAQVYPIKWNPHLSEADVAKEITLGGPKAFPFKLYSAQFRDDDMYGEMSLSGLGLPMY